eukprot:CAMPEP_0176434394 /NCGR_PEP_ID=MMETSP0127-20121128/16652_1 /TAXON_ID=938130 /ORGANISM="Platyophrya macrostoma, Strain WH" /LENGTH=166 /DNA_ID=CAMNT_0017817125 /DNA_START=247 /DNA_END=747 /DNA_ORIENTATION=+
MMPVGLANLRQPVFPLSYGAGLEGMNQTNTVLSNPAASKQTEDVSKSYSLNLSGEDSTPSTSNAEEDHHSVGSVEKVSSTKKIKKQNTCGHTDKPHYARGLCNNCYHRHGRTKKPWLCNHEKLYAHGLCQKCYKKANRRSLANEAKEAQAPNVQIHTLSEVKVESP